MDTEFNNDTQFEVAKHIVITELDGESVLLNSLSGQYFGLNQVGNFALQSLKGDPSFTNICNAVCQKFNVDKETATIDLQELLSQLIDNDILSVKETA